MTSTTTDGVARDRAGRRRAAALRIFGGMDLAGSASARTAPVLRALALEPAALWRGAGWARRFAARAGGAVGLARHLLD